MNPNSELLLRAYRDLPKLAQKDFVTCLLKEPGVSDVIVNRIKISLLDGKPNGISSPPVSAANTKTSKRRLVYDSPGTLTSEIRGRIVSIQQFPGRRFKATIGGTDYARLSMHLVEEELGISVNRKSGGGNSETLSRAIYRHLVDRYNSGDESVIYHPSNT